MQRTKNGARVYARPNGFVLSRNYCWKGWLDHRQDQVSRPLFRFTFAISIISLPFSLPLARNPTLNPHAHDFAKPSASVLGTAEKNAKGKEGTIHQN